MHIGRIGTVCICWENALGHGADRVRFGLREKEQRFMQIDNFRYLGGEVAANVASMAFFSLSDLQICRAIDPIKPLVIDRYCMISLQQAMQFEVTRSTALFNQLTNAAKRLSIVGTL